MNTSRMHIPLDMSVEELAGKIDHAILQPWIDLQKIYEAVEIVKKYKLRCLITTPLLAKTIIETTNGICVGSVVGFPYGYSTIESKIKELEDVIGYGVNEADIVVNYHAYVSGNKELFENEVRAITAICNETGIVCKIIIEAPAHPPDRLVEIIRIVAKYEPDYIKTSSGYGPRPTFPEDVLLISNVLRKLGLRGKIGIKAAGGIRTRLQAILMMVLGADIIGTSTPLQILQPISSQL